MSQHPLGVGGAAFRTRRGDASVDTVPYAAYRREVFDRLGLFDESLVRNQDFEFNARIRKAGGKLLLMPDLEIAYYNVADHKRLAVQAFNNGRWLPDMWAASPHSFRWRHAAPLVLVVGLVACILLAPLTRLAVVAGGMTLLIYVSSVALAAANIAMRAGAALFLPLMAAFFIQHTAYGLGTSAGLINTLFHPRSSAYWTKPLRPRA
jgi:hypothetical protein